MKPRDSRDVFISSRQEDEYVGVIDVPLVVAGDFNMPTESYIFKNNWGDFLNAFAERGSGFGYTKTTWLGPIAFGSRIDHVLASHHWTVGACWTGIDIGSDHVPLVADIVLGPPEK